MKNVNTKEPVIFTDLFVPINRNEFDRSVCFGELTTRDVIELSSRILASSLNGVRILTVFNQEPEVQGK